MPRAESKLEVRSATFSHNKRCRFEVRSSSVVNGKPDVRDYMVVFDQLKGWSCDCFWASNRYIPKPEKYKPCRHIRTCQKHMKSLRLP
jgi:hypothetical protein